MSISQETRSAASTAASRDVTAPEGAVTAPEVVLRSLRAARDDPESWRDSAACRHADPDLFFPIGTTGMAVADIEQAKAVCAGCPVQPACLTYALTTHQQFGIWGGSDEEQRRLLRRRWRENPEAQQRR